MRDVVAALGDRLGWTPAQAWTVVPGLAVVVPVVVATVVGVLGQPAPEPAAALGLPVPAAPGAVAPTPAPEAPVVPPAVVPDLPVPVAVAPPALLPGLVLPAAPGPRPGPGTAQPSAPAPATRPSALPSPEPLRVTDNGSTSTVGADPTLPAGDLPVQAGPLGEVARSFVRLSGSGRVLRLALDATPGATYGEAAAGVRACPNTDARWLSGSGQSPAAAPPVDEPRCVPGTSSDGTWSFDVSAFPDLTGAGLSLLPDPAGPAPYRLAFRTSLEDA